LENVMKPSLAKAVICPRRIVLLLVAAAAVASAPIRAQTGSEMEIGVRAGIDPVEKTKRDHDPAYAQSVAGHGQVYVLASVKEETTEQKLIKPVNARAIADELKRQLKLQGFRPAGPQEKPDVVLTVKYARGFINNPYINPDLLPGPSPTGAAPDMRKFRQQHLGLSDDDPVSGVLPHSSFVGLDAKAAAQDAEKLMIQVRAWKYPPPADPKKRAQLVWMTTMYTGDPDHLDLNLVMPKLLAAGAPHFNQHLDRESPAIINTDIPDGHVNVGTPEVVPPANSSGK
jgi:hypothetical protein